MLLRAYLFRWTQRILKSNAKTIDSFWLSEISSAITRPTWHQLLSTLSLHTFELTPSDWLVKGKGVAFQDIESFLKRYSKLRFLALSGLPFPIQHFDFEDPSFPSCIH